MRLYRLSFAVFSFFTFLGVGILAAEEVLIDCEWKIHQDLRTRAELDKEVKATFQTFNLRDSPSTETLKCTYASNSERDLPRQGLPLRPDEFGKVKATVPAESVPFIWWNGKELGLKISKSEERIAVAPNNQRVLWPPVLPWPFVEKPSRPSEGYNFIVRRWSTVVKEEIENLKNSETPAQKDGILLALRFICQLVQERPTLYNIYTQALAHSDDNFLPDGSSKEWLRLRRLWLRERLITALSLKSEKPSGPVPWKAVLQSIFEFEGFLRHAYPASEERFVVLALSGTDEAALKGYRDRDPEFMLWLKEDIALVQHALREQTKAREKIINPPDKFANDVRLNHPRRSQQLARIIDTATSAERVNLADFRAIALVAGDVSRD